MTPPRNRRRKKNAPGGVVKVKAPELKKVFAPDILHWIPPKSLMCVISSGVTYMMCKAPFDGSIATLSLLGNWMFNSFFDADVQVKLTRELGP